MTVTECGELVLTCGGISQLTLTVGWTQQVAAECTSVSVTKLSLLSGDGIGRFTVNGTVAVDGNVVLRSAEDGLQFDVERENVAADAAGACVNTPYSVTRKGGEAERVKLSVQLNGVHLESGNRYYADGETRIALTELPRVGEVMATSGEIGSTMMITVAAARGEDLHCLRYVCGDVEGIIGENVPEGALEWEIPMALCGSIPQSTQGICTICCDTYRDGVYVGTHSTEAELRVPLSASLWVDDGWLRFVPENDGTAAEGLDCFVRGYSRVKAVFDEGRISAESAYGAVAESFALTVDGITYGAPYVSHVLRDFGVQRAMGSVTDSRGRRIAESMRISVLPYAPPVLTSAAVFRCDSDGAPNEYGDSVSVTAQCSFSVLDGHNAVAITARLRTADGVWSHTASVQNGETAVLWQGVAVAEETYEVALDAIDSLGASTSLTFTLPTTRVFFQGREGGRGAAFGKYAEADELLDVAWGLKTEGNLTVEGDASIGGKPLRDWAYPVGGVYTGHGDADPAALFGGTWAEADDSVKRWIRIT